MNHVVRTEPITEEEFDNELRSWEGTPYLENGCSRAGIDCLRFIVLMQDWLHGWDTKKLSPIPQRSGQISIHAPKEVFKVIQWMQDRYPNEQVWDRKLDRSEFDLRPSDIVVVRNQINPGHALLGGVSKNTCWHALPHPSLKHGGNVHETSIGWCLTMGIVSVYRVKESLLVPG